jgi:competence protein ComEA
MKIASRISNRPPHLWVMIIGAGALVGAGMWTANRRTARVDDSWAVQGQLASTVSWPDMRIDINVAGVGELALLPGVGERLAQRIIDDRDSRGPFASLDELDRVSGMGTGVVERLRPFAVASQLGPAP